MADIKPTFDKLSDDTVSVFVAWGKDQEHRRRDALILDQGNREISNGQALLEVDPPLAVFWPASKTQAGLNVQAAVNLKLSDGQRFSIWAMWRGPVSVGEVYHIHYGQISPCQMDASNPKIIARVTKAKGETGFARFDSVHTGDQAWLILDRGELPDNEPVLYPSMSGVLIGDGERVIRSDEPLPPLCKFVGPLIDVQPYLHLPAGRLGFVIID